MKILTISYNWPFGFPNKAGLEQLELLLALGLGPWSGSSGFQSKRGFLGLILLVWSWEA